MRRPRSICPARWNVGAIAIRTAAHFPTAGSPTNPSTDALLVSARRFSDLQFQRRLLEEPPRQRRDRLSRKIPRQRGSIKMKYCEYIASALWRNNPVRLREFELAG